MLINELELFVSLVFEKAAGRFHFQFSKTHFFCLLCFVFSLIFISWRLITLQYCSGFCHTLT